MSGGKGKSGGGGTSGKVGYPTYVEKYHELWLSDLDGYYRAAASNNPYENAESYDPSNETATMQEAALMFADYIDTFEPTSQYQGAFSAAQGMTEAWGADSTHIDALGTLYSANQALALAEAQARLNAGLADINAVQSSAFVVGNALLEAQFTRDADAFRESLYVNKEKDIAGLIGQGVQGMLQLGQARLEAKKQSSAMSIEAARMVIAALNDQYKEDIEYDVKDVTWELEMNQEAMSTLGSPGGAVPAGGEKGLKNKNSPLQGALSGALSGASAGAMTGNPAAMGWGAVIGGIGGAFSG